MASSAITGPVLSDVRRSPSGSAAAPSWSFADSTGTGVYLASTDVLALSTAGVQRVVVDSAGNVGIGTDSPARNLVVYGTFPVLQIANDTTGSGSGDGLLIYQNGLNGVISNQENGYLGLETNNAERMRIDASGNLLVGKTSESFTTTGSQLTALGGVNGTTAGNADAIAGYNKTTTTNQIIYSGYSNVGSTLAAKFFVYADGNTRIAAGSTYGNFSDIKFKENIVDATPKLNDVLKLQVRNFTIKNEGLKAIGFIAQEFEQVFPALVVTSPDKDVEGNELGTESKAIKESALIPILVKAIQELEARLAALESK